MNNTIGWDSVLEKYHEVPWEGIAVIATQMQEAINKDDLTTIIDAATPAAINTIKEFIKILEEQQ